MIAAGMSRPEVLEPGYDYFSVDKEAPSYFLPNLILGMLASFMVSAIVQK